MTRTRIKVCGVTSTEDAEMCFSLGVDYIGLIFADSPRKVTIETAIKIRSHLPEARLVGVFRDSSPAFVKRTLKSCGLDLIQLHGQENSSYCERLSKETSTAIIKAIYPSSGFWPPVPGMNGSLEYLLFDLDKAGIAPFGRPSTSSLEKLWLKAKEAASKGRKIFLAGGLTPINVREAIRMVKPFSVDVCRSVEREPGVKDKELLEGFIEEVSG